VTLFINGAPVDDQRSLYSDPNCFEPPLGPSSGESYILKAYVGGLWNLTWRFYYLKEGSPCASMQHPRAFHTLSIWEYNPPITNGRLAPVDRYENWCVYPDETLTQAYMRHLREIYSPRTFQALTGTQRYEVDNSALLVPDRTYNPDNDNNIDEFDNELVRFGMSDSSIHIPVLFVSFYEANPQIARQLIWNTFRFQINKDTDRGVITMPITNLEFVLPIPLATCSNP